MNDDVKEILIDFINYYNTMGTESDPGVDAFQHTVKRATNALKCHAEEERIRTTKRSSDVDPFAMDVVSIQEQLTLKFESDW